MNMDFEMANMWAWFFLPLPLVIFWLLPPLRKKRTSLRGTFLGQVSELTGEKPKGSAWVSKRNWLSWVSVLCIWVLFLFALSSPRLVGKPEKKIKTARSFLVAADISFSMANKDWTVNGQIQSRWEAVKGLMKNFVEERKSDKVGLIFFGTNAYLQAPLTTDHATIQWFLDQTEVGMAGQMTGIGNAIGLSMKVLEKDTLAHKVVLLLTDGVDGGSDITPSDAATLAKANDVVIYTIGIGDPTKKNSDLDERTLINIAEITGGKYFRAIDPAKLNEIYATLNELEPIEYEDEEYKPTTLLYYYPLALIILIALFHQVVVALINLMKK